MFAQHVVVGHVVGYLAHPVHVVGKRDQARGLVRQFREGAADPTGARNLAEGADVRQARGAVAGFEQNIGFRLARGLVAFHALEKLAGFLEGPGFGGHC